MNKKKRMCKYPDCMYYDPKATIYCCSACASDAYDCERLKKEKTKNSGINR